MTTFQTKPSINIELIGKVLTNIGEDWRYTLTSKAIADAYPNENAEAYAAAFLDKTRNVFLEDTQEKGPLHPVKDWIEELAKKITASGGWKLFIERYQVDKIAVGAWTFKAATDPEGFTQIIIEFLRTLLALVS